MKKKAKAKKQVPPKKGKMVRQKENKTVFKLNPKQNLLIFSILTILSFALYSNAIPFGYTFDDKIVITRNESTKAGIGGIKDLLTRDAFSNYFGKQQKLVSGGRYRPLAPITFALEFEFFSSIDENGEIQGNSHLSHIINILFYALTGYVLYLVLSRLLTKFSVRRWYLSIPFLSAVLFIAHPVHTEVVANVKGRDEILVLLGSLLTLWWVIKYLDTKKISYIISATVMFFLAHTSKENAITFLAVIPLSVYFFTNHSLKDNLKTLIPLSLAAIVFIIIRHKVLGETFATTPPELMNNPFLYATTGQKYATIFYTWGMYLKLMFFPYQLTYDYYPYHIELVNFSNSITLLSIFSYLSLGILAIRGLIKRTLIGFSLTFYFATFSIVSNLFFPIGAFMNERFIFVPSVAFAIITAYVAYFFFEKKKGKLSIIVTSVLLLIVLGLYSVKTYDRNRVWESDYTLFTTDVNTSKGSAFGNLTAGKQFLFKAEKLTDSVERKKYFEKAIFHLTNAVTIHKKYVNGLYFLGEAHYKYNRNYDKTIEYFERLIQLTPDKAQLHYRLGAIFGKYKKNYKKAEYYLEQSLKYDPKNKESLQALGAILFNSKQNAKALEVFKRLASYYPNDPIGHKNLGAVYMKMGDNEKANYHLNLAKEKK